MKVLIIEDESKIASLIKEGLSEQSYISEICHDGPSGLSYALTEEYDVIILDRMLPGGMDGLEICQKIRAAGNHVPILMLTAKTTTSDRVAGLDAGADDYLIKPFSFDELRARLQALLRRPHESLGEILSYQDLKLNLISKDVSRANQSIHLSAKEYAILEYLLRNKGKVLSKNAILNHVWDFDSDVLPSTVEVFIVYLRAKIEKPFNGPKVIQTVRGFGYKIEEDQ